MPNLNKLRLIDIQILRVKLKTYDELFLNTNPKIMSTLYI